MLLLMEFTHKVIGYFNTGLAIFPLVAAQVIYPPLSVLYGSEKAPDILASLYASIPRKYLKSSFISYYLLRPNVWDQDASLAWISHIFVHGSYTHLLGNLYGLWLSAVPIYERLGAPAVYIAFFGGGICAALPSDLYSTQFLRSSREIDRSIDGLVDGSLIANLAKPIISGGAKLINRVAELNLKCCGSSGAVYSLWGLSTVLLVQESMQTFLYGDGKSSTGKKAATIGGNVANILFFASYLMAEAGNVFGTSDKGLLKAVFSQGKSIGHAAHLQGALFGIVMGLAVVMVRGKQDSMKHIKKIIEI